MHELRVFRVLSYSQCSKCMNSDRSGSSCMDPIRVESQFNESTACMQNFSPAARARGVQRIELTQFTMPSQHTDRYTGDWSVWRCLDGIRFWHDSFVHVPCISRCPRKIPSRHLQRLDHNLGICCFIVCPGYFTIVCPDCWALVCPDCWALVCPVGLVRATGQKAFCPVAAGR